LFLGYILEANRYSSMEFRWRLSNLASTDVGHAVADGQLLRAKWDYVKSNPVRHGLVLYPEQWPFKGELNPLSWHDP